MLLLIRELFSYLKTDFLSVIRLNMLPAYILWLWSLLFSAIRNPVIGAASDVYDSIRYSVYDFIGVTNPDGCGERCMYRRADEDIEPIKTS